MNSPPRSKFTRRGGRLRGESPACSLILPTRNRRDVLQDTLRRLSALTEARIEIIVVDNASTDGTPTLHSEFPRVRWIALDTNHGAAARNLGGAAADAPLLLMLDDDSWPEPGTIARAVSLFEENPRLAVASCRVRLADPPHRHDAGGLPGVFFNCGAFIRRDAFLEAGGYPIDYDYYVEEYDLSCRLLRRGWEIQSCGELLVWHRRTTAGRDNNRMLRFLVRNNLRLWHRYAPASRRRDLLDQTVERYRRVAARENALAGFEQGLAEGRAKIADGRPRPTPLSQPQFEALFDLSRVRRRFRSWIDGQRIRTVILWTRGKGCEQLHDLIKESIIDAVAVDHHEPNLPSWRGCRVQLLSQFVPQPGQGLLVGSLSPGVSEDLFQDLSAQFPSVPLLAPAAWSHYSPAAPGIG